MPRSRSDDESRQPILRGSNVDSGNYQDNELEDVTCCDPRKGYFRFIGLIFMCLVGFGEYKSSTSTSSSKRMNLSICVKCEPAKFKFSDESGNEIIIRLRD